MIRVPDYVSCQSLLAEKYYQIEIYHQDLPLGMMIRKYLRRNIELYDHKQKMMPITKYSQIEIYLQDQKIFSLVKLKYMIMIRKLY